jgi:PAS domain S-box-containing protein
MPIVERDLALLRHPRLAALATSAWPAWLWSVDGSRLLWANAVGAAIFGGVGSTASTQRRFDVGDAFTAQIIRLAAMLPSGAHERFERLRGLGAGFGRALTCACSRIVLDDGTGAVLVAACEPAAAGPPLTLAELVRRLFADDEEAISEFAPDGTLLYANAAAQTRLSGVTTLSALGIEALAATTLETGSGSGTARLGQASFDVAAMRLGVDMSRVIVLTLPQRTNEVPSAQNAAVKMEPGAVAASEPAVAAPAPAPDVTPANTAPAPLAQKEEPIAERRHPLRFVWNMDADGRFGIGSDEFIGLAGPRTMTAVGRLWSEIAEELNLDPNNQVARAVATRETWSGIVVSWPVDDTDEQLPIELSGLPVFDRDRSFRGYRGFGVCRDIVRINQLAQARREQPIGFVPAQETAPEPPQQTVATPTPPAPAAPDKMEPAAAVEAAPAPDRPALSVAPASANVLPFRQSPPPEPKSAPALSPVERRAFRELAQELTSRLRGSPQVPATAESGPEGLPAEHPEEAETAAAAEAAIEQALLDRIPIGILVYRHDSLFYANRHFLEWTGYENLTAIESAGGVTTLFAESGTDALAETAGSQSVSIMTRRGDKLRAEGRLFTVPWNGSSALALILTNGQNNGNAEAGRQSDERAPGAAENENRELKSMLDAASDGIVTLDAEGRIAGANARAASLFGKPTNELVGRILGELFASESNRAAHDYFDRILRGTNVLDNVLDVDAHAGEDRMVPLTMTLIRIGDDRFCAVFRDATNRKQTEEELRNAKREALRAASAKAEFLAKVSHEIRTPLNAMTGFAEVIMAERFGPIGNERYREYVKDIHGAGTHLVSMLNDLLDLSRIETGQIDLSFTNVNLNDLTQQCVGIMQPQANRARIIIRTALTPGLPLVIADERSLRQIVLNLLTNSIKFTGPGGQVIVSTVFSDAREAVLRVRDTGVGMSDKDIQAALEPFQQTATSGIWGSGGTGFGLPLTKALAEANRANFSIKSAPNAGTLVEIAFPPSRIVAD